MSATGLALIMSPSDIIDVLYMSESIADIFLFIPEIDSIKILFLYPKEETPPVKLNRSSSVSLFLNSKIPVSLNSPFTKALFSYVGIKITS